MFLASMAAHSRQARGHLKGQEMLHANQPITFPCGTHPPPQGLPLIPALPSRATRHCSRSVLTILLYFLMMLPAQIFFATLPLVFQSISLPAAHCLQTSEPTTLSLQTSDPTTLSITLIMHQLRLTGTPLQQSPMKRLPISVVALLTRRATHTRMHISQVTQELSTGQITTIGAPQGSLPLGPLLNHRRAHHLPNHLAHQPRPSQLVLISPLPPPSRTPRAATGAARVRQRVTRVFRLTRSRTHFSIRHRFSQPQHMPREPTTINVAEPQPQPEH